MKLLLNFLYSFLFFCQISNAGASSAKPEPSLISNMRLGIGIAGEYATVDANLEVRPAESLGVNTSSSQQQACKKISSCS